ncbi:Pr6Pr family membrane protein [Pseudolysinimonas sp.]
MTARRGLGILHLAVAALLLFTYVFQIVDLVVGGSFVADEYFVYFTNDTTMIAIVVLTLTGVSMLRRERDGVWLTAAALAVVPYALVTGIVYNLTLRGMPSEVYLGMPWANEVLHVAMPLVLALDWFVLRLADRGRPALPWRGILVALIFPIVWVTVTYVRGALTGWYPYPFLEPAAGPAVIGGYVGGIAVFVVVVTALGILVSRARVVRSDSAGTT